MSGDAPIAVDELLSLLEEALDWRELQRCTELVQQLPASVEGDVGLKAALLRARVAQVTDPTGEVERLSLEALHLAQRRQDVVATADAVAGLCAMPGTRATFTQRLPQVLPDTVGHPAVRARVLAMMGADAIQVKALDRIEAWFLEAHACALEAGRPGVASQHARALAAVLNERRRFDEALVWVDRSVALARERSGPRLAAALEQRAGVLWSREQLEDARASAREAASYEIGLDWVLRGRIATRLSQLGQNHRAVELLRPLFEEAPRHRITIGFALALALARLGRLEEARGVAGRLTTPIHRRLVAANVVLIQQALAPLGPSGADPIERAAALVGLDEDVVFLTALAADQHPDPQSVAVTRLRVTAARTAEQMGRADLAPGLAEQLRDLPESFAVPLGAFDVGAPLGRGGHARVYTGRHHRTGVPVAIKVLSEPTRPDELEREARLVARLRHPHVVGMLGFGHVDEWAARMRPRAWTEGSAWLAMELVRDGTLVGWAGRLEWSEVHRILEAVLLALAHAHARGVLHLDLKPANVLLDRTAEGWVPKLADFGVASMLQTRTRQVTGTPTSMAPEQWLGRAEELGPWTDLYGLGCLAVAMVTGAPAFPSTTLPVLREMHRSAPRPVLPEERAPDGLQDWVHRLMAVDPGDRPATAAEALQGLRELPREWPLTVGPLPAPLPAPPTDPPDTLAPTFALTASWSPVDEVPRPARAARPPRARTAALPPSWPAPGPRPPLMNTDLLREGLSQGVLGPLAAVAGPVWQALREVEATGRGRVLAWSGGDGHTLWTNLGQWVREAGGAAGFARGSDAAELLGHAVRRLLLHALAPVSPELLESRALRVDAETREILVDLLGGTLRPGAAEAVLRLLHTRLAGRPCLMVADVTGDALQVLEAHLETLLDGPLLLVVRAPFEAAEHTLILPELTPDEIAALLSDRLPLEHQLLDGLVRRSSGNVDRALALLDTQIREGHLEPTGHGWRLVPGAVLPPLDTPAEHTEIDAMVAQGRLHEASERLAGEAGEAARQTDQLALSRVLDRWLQLAAQHPEVSMGPRYPLYRGVALAMADELERARPYLLEATGHPETLGQAHRWLASMARAVRDLEGTERHLTAGLSATTDPDGRAAILTRLAWLRFEQGRREEAEQLTREALAEPGPGLQARLGQLAMTLPGEPDTIWTTRAQALREEALRLGRDDMARRVDGFLGVAAALCGDDETVTRLLGVLPEYDVVVVKLLCGVRTRDDATVARMLSGSQADFLGRRNWRPLVQLWLEAEAPEHRWHEVLQRWRPWCAPGPVAVWLLDRVLERLTTPERRDDVRGLVPDL